MPAALIGIGIAVGGAAMSSALVAAGWAAATAALASAVAAMGVAWGLNSILHLTPRSRTSNPQIELTNIISNVAGIPFVYGPRRIGGSIVLAVTTDRLGETRFPNAILHLFLVLGEGEINQVTAVQFDGVDSEDASIADKNFWQVMTGADDQLACASLAEYYPDLLATDRLRGTAYLYLRLGYSSTAFPNGLPTITADGEWRLVYDPRDDALKYSDNPALIIRDYLIHQRAGGMIWNITAENLDEPSFIAAANHCDELVTKGEAEAKRYTCAAVLSPDDDPRENLRDLLSSCMGWIDDSSGLVSLIIPQPRIATGFDFNDDNLVGDVRVTMGSRDTLINRVRCRFFNAANNFAQDMVVVDSEDLRELDHGILLEKEIELPCTPDASTVQQICTIMLNRSRQAIVVERTAKLEAINCVVGDVVTYTSDTFGWDAKEFEIAHMEHLPNDEVKVTLAEYADDVYDFGTIPVIDSAPDTDLPNPTVIGAPGPPSVSEELYATRNGRGVAAKALLTWLASEDPFIDQYQIEYKLSSASEWSIAGRTSATSLEILDITPGVYEFRVAAIGTLPGVMSPYNTTSNVSISGLLALPSDVTGLTVTALSGVAMLIWDQHPDLDVRIGGRIRFRHYQGSSPAWNKGNDLGGGGVPGGATTATMPLMQGYYMAKAVDSSGQESTTEATIYNAAPSPWTVTENASSPIQEDATFAGTKTGCEVNDSALQLTVVSGEVTASGSYLFDNDLDLGAVEIVQLRTEIDSAVAYIQDTIDSRTTLMDTWPSWDGSAGALAEVNVYVRFKAAAEDAWSDWERLAGVGDFSARYFEFKAELASSDAAHNIVISQLRVRVWNY